MNILSYRKTDDNGLSFELLVDGQPLGELIGSRDMGIPYWIFEDDLPYFPPHAQEHDPEVRIVAVCSCGEYGCGHAQCHVVREGETIVFHSFDCDVSPEGSEHKFRFSTANYDFVILEIIREVAEHGGRA